MSKIILAIFAASILGLSAASGANAASVQSKAPQTTSSTSTLESVWPRAESLGN